MPFSRNLSWLVHALSLPLLLATGLHPPACAREIMETQDKRLVGRWEKITSAACSLTYPDNIEFLPNGLYRGHAREPGMFSKWDTGTYQPVGADELKISTANDAVVSYRFTFLGEVATFSDPEGCEFSYRRLDR